MRKPLNITGWFKVEHVSGVKASLPKAIYIDDWDNKLVRILLEQRYLFIPVHVLTDNELSKLVKEAVQLELNELENKYVSSEE